MKLGDKRAHFTASIAQLIVVIQGLVIDGKQYRVRLDACKRTKAGNRAVKGHPRSTHLSGLAADILLDYSTDNGKSWIWVVSGKDPGYKFLHDIWDKLGGSRRIKRDMGHFSFKHQGIR